MVVRIDVLVVRSTYHTASSGRGEGSRPHMEDVRQVNVGVRRRHGGMGGALRTEGGRGRSYTGHRSGAGAGHGNRTGPLRNEDGER